MTKPDNKDVEATMDVEVTTTEDTSLTLSDIKKMPEKELTAVEKKEMEVIFRDAKDFRELGEKITAPIDSIIAQTSVIIDEDPVMQVSNELAVVNEGVQGVYKEIIDNDNAIMRSMKKIPLIGGIVSAIDNKVEEASFNHKSVEGKINTIFAGFDTANQSLNKSINMQQIFLKGLDDNIGKVVAYNNFLSAKLEEFQVRQLDTVDDTEKMKMEMFIRHAEFFQNNLVVLIGNLDLARKRVLMRLDSAGKLSLAMSSSRPIFKTLLSTAMIETSSQKANEAALKTISVLGQTIDKMSTELTDKAVSSAKKTEELTSKAVLSADVFFQNVEKLKNHFETIESYRTEMREKALAERKKFEEASSTLSQLKLISAEGHQELENELLLGKIDETK